MRAQTTPRRTRGRDLSPPPHTHPGSRLGSGEPCRPGSPRGRHQAGCRHLACGAGAAVVSHPGPAAAHRQRGRPLGRRGAPRPRRVCRRPCPPQRGPYLEKGGSAAAQVHDGPQRVYAVGRGPCQAAAGACAEPGVFRSVTALWPRRAHGRMAILARPLSQRCMELIAHACGGRGCQLAQTGAHPGKRKIGANEPCPCGSGRKYKRCHGV